MKGMAYLLTSYCKQFVSAVLLDMVGHGTVQFSSAHVATAKRMF